MEGLKEMAENDNFETPVKDLEDLRELAGKVGVSMEGCANAAGLLRWDGVSLKEAKKSIKNAIIKILKQEKESEPKRYAPGDKK